MKKSKKAGFFTVDSLKKRFCFYMFIFPFLGRFYSFFSSLGASLGSSLRWSFSLFLFILCFLAQCNDVEKSFISSHSPPQLKWDLGELELAEELMDAEIAEEAKWLYRHRLASSLLKRGDALTACSYWLDLVEQQGFSLKDLALLKAYLYCPDSSYESLPPFYFYTYQSKKWLHFLIEQIYLNKLEASYVADSPSKVLKTLVGFADKYRKSRSKRKELLFLEKALAWIQHHPRDFRPSLRQKIQDQLYALSPSQKGSSITDFAKEEWIDVAEDYVYWRKWPEAIHFYKTVLKTKAEDGFDFQDYNRVYQGLYRAYRALGKRTLADKVAGQRFRWISEELALRVKQVSVSAEPIPQELWEIYHSAAHTFVRRLWTQNKTKEALKHLHQALSMLKGNRSRQSLYALLGRITHEQRQPHQVLKWLDQALKERKQSGPGGQDSNPEALEGIYWMKAWTLLEQSQYQAAGKVLEEWLSWVEATPSFHFSRSSNKFKYLFWLAFSWKAIGEEEKAKAKWEFIAQEDFLGYYGLLSHYQLNKDLPLLKSEPLSKTFAGVDSILIQHLGKKAFLTLEWLYQAEEWTLLKHFLDGYFFKWQDSFRTNPQLMLGLLIYYAKSRDFLLLFKKVHTSPVEARRSFFFAYPHLLFPQIYKREIQDALVTVSLEDRFRILVHSIIRQESAFNWRARSPVGALGLMQVMPSTAKSVNGNNQWVVLHSNEDIFKVENNLLLGTLLLKKLKKTYSNQWLLMAAAYNAGNTPVQGWLSHYRDDKKGLLFFIENIPYKETQGYVKLVFRNLILYRLLNEPSSFKKVPSELLEF